MAENGRKIFVMGHPEYDRITLDQEYKRDLSKGLDIQMPKHYYTDDDPSVRPPSYLAGGGPITCTPTG